MMKNKSMTSAMTGMAVGAVVGTAAYMMSGKSQNARNMKKIKRTANHAVRNAGVFVDSMSNMMK